MVVDSDLIGGGGLTPGAKVWVLANSQDGMVGWVKGILVSTSEGADGITEFTVEEEELRASDDGNFTLSESHAPITRIVTSKRSSALGNYPDIHLRNEELEIDASEGEASTVDDLIKLTHLHEPAILHTIELRYWKGLIYTYTGPILIACNPFKRLGIYSDQHLMTYRSAGQHAAARMEGKTTSLSGPNGEKEDGRPLPPHIYAVAGSAYRSMMGPLSGQGTSPNQSILVSGESGAGKTESTKFIMQYLAVISSQTAGSDDNLTSLAEDDSTISSQVLQSNPILESFGNARTIRNDNSSRFGKFIELHFEKADGRLSGASISTYLLEKVRIVSQSEGERNYHIFYQMIRGASAEEREKLSLGLGGLEDGNGFHFISQSGCYSRLDGANDADDYRRMRKAMTIMGFDEEEQFKVMKVVAAVLHLGNLHFTIKGDEDQNSPESAQVSQETLDVAVRVAELLEVDPTAFTRSLTNRNIQAGREMVNVNLTPAQAEGARDALAKAVYGNLFLWLVSRVNTAIGLKEDGDGAASSRRSSRSASFDAAGFVSPIKTANLSTSSSGSNMFIGVLDIFGFESFQRNSFEQLCINYANETLQQQFNQFVFKLEQEEYEREDISWSFVEFPDNQECLELLENRTMGILALLDEQCVVPKATDQTLASRLYEKCKEHPRFTVSPWDRVDYRFTIQHYAGTVTYDTAGFLDKNKDQLYQETIDLLQSSECSLVQSLLKASTLADAVAAVTTTIDMSSSPSLATTSRGTPNQGRRRSAVAPLTVGSQFKGQLGVLLTRIRSTRPHYVRCLKPNDRNVSAAFDQARIIEQLRCGGVLEAVRVSRSGYPTRMTHSQFYHRYRPLTLTEFEVAMKEAKAHRLSSGRDLDRSLAEAVIKGLMLTLWEKKTKEGRSLPSSQERTALPFKEQLAHVGLQLGKTKVFFRLQAFEEIETMRGRLMQIMAIRLQAALRAFTRQHAYQRLKTSTLTAQRVVRGFLDKRRVRHKRHTLSATRIQSLARGVQARKQRLAVMHMIIRLQTRQRGIIARQQVLEIRRERAAVKLQSWTRMSKERMKLGKVRLGVTFLNSYVRRFLAKRELRRLRIAAKDLGNALKEKNTLLGVVSDLKGELAVVMKERDEALLKVEEVSQKLEAAAARSKEEREGSSSDDGNAKLNERIKALEAELAAGATMEEKGPSFVEDENARLNERIKALEAELAAATAREKRPSSVDDENTRLNERIKALEAELQHEKRRNAASSSSSSPSPPCSSISRVEVKTDGNDVLSSDVRALQDRIRGLEAEVEMLRSTTSIPPPPVPLPLPPSGAEKSSPSSSSQQQQQQQLLEKIQALEGQVKRLEAELASEIRLKAVLLPTRPAPLEEEAPTDGGNGEKKEEEKEMLWSFKQQIIELRLQLAAAKDSTVESDSTGRKEERYDDNTVLPINAPPSMQAHGPLVGPNKDTDSVGAASGEAPIEDDVTRASSGEAEVMSNTFSMSASLASSSIRSRKDSFCSAMSELDGGTITGGSVNNPSASASFVEPFLEDTVSQGTLSPSGTEEEKAGEETLPSPPPRPAILNVHSDGEEEEEGEGDEDTSMITPPDLLASPTVGPLSTPTGLMNEGWSADELTTGGGSPAGFLVVEENEGDDHDDGLTASKTSPGLSARFVSTMTEMSTKNFLLILAKSAEDSDVILDMIQHRLSKEPMEAWPELVNSTDRDGRTPLHLAALGGSPRIAELLLTHGATPNFYDKFDDTPLHLSHCDAITKVLLKYGANPALPNRLREISLHVAVKNKDTLSLEALLQHPHHRKWINEQDERGFTALHVAARVGSLDAVALLITHGASTEAADKQGMRPIHVMCSSVDRLLQGPGIVHYLLDKRADGAARTARGFTALHLIADNPQHVTHPHDLCHMADLILDRGVEADVAALDGSTPLHLAARNNFEDLAALLVQRGGCLTIPWCLPSGSSIDSLPSHSVSSSISASSQHSRSISGTTPSCGSGSYRLMGGGSSSCNSNLSKEVLAVDLFAERCPSQLYRMIQNISVPQEQVKDRSRTHCMDCKSTFTVINRRHHCRYCQRLLCHSCSSAQISRDCFPPAFSEVDDFCSSPPEAPVRVCNVCYQVLSKRDSPQSNERRSASNSIDGVRGMMRSVISSDGGGVGAGKKNGNGSSISTTSNSSTSSCRYT